MKCTLCLFLAVQLVWSQNNENIPEPVTSSIDQETSTSTLQTTSSTEATSVPSSVSNVTEPTPSSASTESTTSTKPQITEDDYESAFLEPPVCGESQATLSRVVGGVDAKLGDFPWIGQIAYRVKGGFMFKCGASLITSHHAMTAAHCINGKEDSIYFVRLGVLDTKDYNETRPVDALIKVAVAHENYSTSNYNNDIGILVFYRRVKFTDFVKPICLPVSSELRSKDFVGYNPFIAGWGRLKFKGPVPTRLQVLQLPVVSQDTCRAAYEPMGLPIDQRDICAGGMGGKDACNGDSGGPLMQPIWDPVNYTTYFYQTGIVSLGVMCGTPGFPTVFTRVTEFIPWIQRIVLGK